MRVAVAHRFVVAVGACCALAAAIGASTAACGNCPPIGPCADVGGEGEGEGVGEGEQGGEGEGAPACTPTYTSDPTFSCEVDYDCGSGNTRQVKCNDFTSGTTDTCDCSVNGFDPTTSFNNTDFCELVDAASGGDADSATQVETRVTQGCHFDG